MRKRIKTITMLFFLLLGLCACGNKETENACECIVELKGLPDEFKKLPENIRKNVEVSVSIENVVTEKHFEAKLTEGNDFEDTLSLNPGTYRVVYVYASPGNLVDLEIKAEEEKFELDWEQDAVIKVSVVNAEEFADWAWSMEASREIVQASAFSGTVQFEGQIIELKQIAQYVEFEYENQIGAYDKVTFGNSDKGVYITVQNQNEEPASWTECEVLEVSFRKNNVIFGQEICLGMDVSEVVHEDTGLLGVPDEMSGTVLMGAGYADTSASYIHGTSGDKLTLVIESGGEYVRSISYAFEVFE